MNTPAHAVFSLLVLGRAEGERLVTWIALGAVLPDLPAMVFYGWEKLVLGRPEGTIWSVDYFRPGWQAVFDGFHSLPLLGLALLAAIGLAWPRTAWTLASMALHALADLPLHADDAHRHFWPLSDFRYESPVSYWDPSRYGLWAAAAEVALVAVGSVVLWRRFQGRAARTPRLLIAAVAACYAIYLAYVLVVWI